MFDLLEKTQENVLATKISGKLNQSDYNQMFPLVEETVAKYGKINLYVELENFEGWEDPKSLWDEFKLSFKHYTDLEKVAIVGEKKWEEFATKASDFVNPAKIKYFSPEQKEEAKNWISE
ncbi:STAS/SEC14 domain-containing protein [Cytophagaceae bacterium ABcell3]|nr:STAS/SEC14 domain-containing protein [Cytophagaceae bacterium ABcell3]